jgi:hypothetical protein
VYSRFFFFVCDNAVFSAVFYVVRAVHKFDFRLFINEKTTSYSERHSCLCRDLYLFPLPSLPVLRDSTHAV